MCLPLGITNKRIDVARMKRKSAKHWSNLALRGKMSGLHPRYVLSSNHLLLLNVTQLWNIFHAPEDVEKALDISLKALGVDYLDLYIIHWPLALNKDGSVYDKELTENPYPTWKALEELVDKGKVRNIGLSKYVP